MIITFGGTSFPVNRYEMNMPRATRPMIACAALRASSRSLSLSISVPSFNSAHRSPLGLRPDVNGLRQLLAAIRSTTDDSSAFNGHGPLSAATDAPHLSRSMAPSSSVT
jgi:hypothetical protein